MPCQNTPRLPFALSQEEERTHTYSHSPKGSELISGERKTGSSAAAAAAFPGGLA